jgi:hypothetical protein
MCHLIWLHRVPVSLRLVHDPWGCSCPGRGKAAGSAALVLVDGAVPLRLDPALFEAMRGRRRSAVRAAAGGAFAGVHDGHIYDGGAGCAEPDAAWSTDEASIPPCIVIEARKAPDRLDGQNISQRESGRISKLRVLLLERARGRQGADPVVVDALAAHELEP